MKCENCEYKSLGYYNKEVKFICIEPKEPFPIESLEDTCKIYPDEYWDNKISKRSKKNEKINS